MFEDAHLLHYANGAGTIEGVVLTQEELTEELIEELAPYGAVHVATYKVELQKTEGDTEALPFEYPLMRS